MALPTQSELASLDFVDFVLPFAILNASSASASLNAFVNVSGTWKQADSVHVNVSGTWKEVDSLNTNVSGTWKS